MEFLIVTTSKSSADSLWEKVRYPQNITTSYLLGKDSISNCIIISDEEVKDEFEGMEEFCERLMKSAIVWEQYR